MHAVTGAYGYTGKYIARRLLEEGRDVITLTGHPDRSNEFGDKVKAYPFDFAHPDKMAESLSGVEVLYNTYWVRFDRADQTHERAVANTLSLFRAAKMAGVKRVVHISITQPDERSTLPYFRGKAVLERELASSGMGYAIVRPTVVFGPEDILINNIAYLLRTWPLFLIAGSGTYKLQPVHALDVARIAVESGGRGDNLIVDAVGPEILTFEQMVRQVGRSIGSRPRLLHVPPGLLLAAASVLGAVKQDVILTKDELDGLMDNRLVSNQPATGEIALSDWLADNSDTVGVLYASELARHYRPIAV